jgi:hypothetical protein
MVSVSTQTRLSRPSGDISERRGRSLSSRATNGVPGKSNYQVSIKVGTIINVGRAGKLHFSIQCLSTISTLRRYKVQNLADPNVGAVVARNPSLPSQQRNKSDQMSSGDCDRIQMR